MSKIFRHFYQLNSSLITKLPKPTILPTIRLFNSEPKTVQSESFVRKASTFVPKEGISSLQIKKRPIRRKQSIVDEHQKPLGSFRVSAFSTAEEYDLEALFREFKNDDSYEPKAIDNDVDVLHAIDKCRDDSEPRELFLFREGTVVMWNVINSESSRILDLLKKFQSDGYAESVIRNEAEFMNYSTNIESKPNISSSGEIIIPPEDNTLEKYTFSNAIGLSVKLGCREASLETYIDAIESVTEDLKLGRTVKMSSADVLRKHGELFALRHVINLSSDLLDTPDFYWERDDLEALYSRVNAYFGIAKRTRVINEKINHCLELVELLSSHLNDKHHVRLEWMVIILIMVEVGFEALHYIDHIH